MRKRGFWENFILGAIILVIIQTFLEDFSRYQHWSVTARNILLLFGLLFDITFTIEFIVRTLNAKKENKVLLYWFYQRGWVDFLSSIPLLLFNSGPSFYFLITGKMEEGAATIGVLNILKVVKAIRVTRILRLIRIMKIFGKIHHAESKMAQHHTATIATTAVFTVICVLILFSVIVENPFEKAISSRTDYYKQMLQNVRNINETMDVPLKAVVFKLFSNDKNVLKIYYTDLLIFSRLSEERFRKFYSIEDYVGITNDEFNLYVSIVDINKQMAAMNIQNFFIIIFIVLAFMIVYTRHFVQTVSDIVHIMRRGFTEKDYNLQVKIKKEYAEHEIFKLAEYYNEVYLPEKLRKQQEEKEKKATTLSMDDLLSFKKPES